MSKLGREIGGARVVRRLALAALFVAPHLSCDDEPTTSSKESAVEADDEIITEPVPPEGFEGDPNETLPITPEEAAAIEAARQLDLARNPPAQDPTDRGFATMCPACVGKRAETEGSTP